MSHRKHDPTRVEESGRAAPPPPSSPHGFPVFASYEQRVAGFLMDVGIPTGLFVAALIAALMSRDRLVIVVVHGLATTLSVTFLVWNSGWCQGRSGQSIGKRVLGMRLVAVASGQPVGFGRAVGRQIAHLLDGLPLLLGYLWPIWDEQRQTFADKVCSTMVVQADV